MFLFRVPSYLSNDVIATIVTDLQNFKSGVENDVMALLKNIV